MHYIRCDELNPNPNAKPVSADPETERMLAEAGFTKAPGAPYYVLGFVEIVVYDDGTWEPTGGKGFLPEEWRKMRAFAGVYLKDFIPWLRMHYRDVDKYVANLKPEDYRKEEKFTFVKVYKDDSSPAGGEYAWFIQQFGLLGSDGVIPADKNAIPRQYWFVNGKCYESQMAFAPSGIDRHFYLNRIPDFDHEMTDPYVIERIKAAFLKEQTE